MMPLPHLLHAWIRLGAQAALCSLLLLVGHSAVAGAQHPDTSRTNATLAPPAPPDSGPPVGPRLSLATVIAQTLANSPNYATAAGAARTSHSFERVAVGAYLPTVTASAVAGRSDQGLATGFSPGGPRGAYGGGVGVSLPLFTGGYRGAVRREAAAQVRSADAGLVFQHFAVRLNATAGYLGVLYGHELVRVGRDAVTVTSRGLSYANAQRAAGTATPADVLQAELAVTTAQRQLLAAHDTLNSNAAELGRLVGAEGPVDAEPLANLDPTALALDDSAIVQTALREAPVVQQAQAQVGVTTAAVRAAKAQYAPTIAATSGYFWSNNGAVSGVARQGWNVLVGATLPLFTGFTREDSVTRANVAADIATASAADTRRQSGAQARQYLGNLHVAEQSVALEREAVRVATENLRVISARYRAGVATILDLLTAQQSLIQAELNLVSARFSYLITRANIEALLGREL